MDAAGVARSYALGQSLVRSFSKNPSQATGAGIFFDLSMSPGNPVPQYYFSTPLTAAPLSRSSDGGLDHGSSPSTGYAKYIHKLLLNNAIAAPVPIHLEMLDYLMYYPGIPMDVGPNILTTSIPLPRQTPGQIGRGVQMMVVEQNPYASAPAAQFFITYTNQDGVTGKVTPIVTCNSQLVTGTIVTSALATAGCAGRFIPLALGDSGVQLVEQIEFTVGDVGLLAIVLVKPVCAAQIYETSAPVEIDYLREFGFLPYIENDAYLNFICKPNGNLSAAPITGELTTIWSDQ